MANPAILILLAVRGTLVHCVQHKISKTWESETSLSDGQVARVMGGSVGLPVLRYSFLLAGITYKLGIQFLSRSLFGRHYLAHTGPHEGWRFPWVPSVPSNPAPLVQKAQMGVTASMLFR